MLVASYYVNLVFSDKFWRAKMVALLPGDQAWGQGNPVPRPYNSQTVAWPGNRVALLPGDEAWGQGNLVPRPCNSQTVAWPGDRVALLHGLGPRLPRMEFLSFTPLLFLISPCKKHTWCDRPWVSE